MSIEEDLSESDCNKSDEHESGNESDQLLSECPEDSSEDEKIGDSEEEERDTRDIMKGIKGKLFTGVVNNDFEFEYG